MKLFPILFSSLFLLILIAINFTGCDKQPNEPITANENFSKKSGIPSNGNGNKIVTEFDETWTLECDASAHMVGWSQFKVFGSPNNRNVDITIFHLVFTYTNSEGEEFVWHDVGPDHWYFVGDDLYVSMTGRSTGSGVIGHVVFNFTDLKFVQISGYDFGDIDALACEELN